MTKHRPHVVEMSVTDEDVLGRDGVVEAGCGADVEDYSLRILLLLRPPFAWLFLGLATGRRDGRVVARAETRSAGAAFVDGRTVIVMISEGGAVRRGGRVFRFR